MQQRPTLSKTIAMEYRMGHQHLTPQEAEFHFQEACKLLDYLLTNYDGICEDDNGGHRIRIFLGRGVDATKRTIRTRKTTLSSPLTLMATVLQTLKPRLDIQGSMPKHDGIHDDYDVARITVIQAL